MIGLNIFAVINTDFVGSLEVLQEAVNVKYSFVIGVMLLVYDVVINLTCEIELIWMCRWSLGKIIYILARYCGFVDAVVILYYSFSANLTTESCHMPFVIAVWCITFGIEICHCVLIVRTFVIWERNMLVLAYTCLFQLTGIVVKVIVISRMIKKVTFTPSLMPSLCACIPSLGTDTVLIVFCIDVVFEFQILILSLYKGFFRWKLLSTPLARTLYRDGFIYFAVLFCISVTNTFVNRLLFSTPYSMIVIIIQRVFHSILASRIIINLRSAVSERFESQFPTISMAVFQNGQTQSDVTTGQHISGSIEHHMYQLD
ncbi:hypothetical protein SCHPADRAFT_418921 [Schizopora paradoxa]|uniref:DUF6533 domain-containing protein n=1 Tax=Schizopora paradoxa TaxID=27342 RepID=A0A0H2RKB5_9AGAM|nr:hypothetical protein SCHPADRAFT_418921 [Schizopora paradoxa]